VVEGDSFDDVARLELFLPVSALEKLQRILVLFLWVKEGLLLWEVDVASLCVRAWVANGYL